MKGSTELPVLSTEAPVGSTDVPTGSSEVLDGGEVPELWTKEPVDVTEVR